MCYVSLPTILILRIILGYEMWYFTGSQGATYEGKIFVLHLLIYSAKPFHLDLSSSSTSYGDKNFFVVVYFDISTVQNQDAKTKIHRYFQHYLT